MKFKLNTTNVLELVMLGLNVKHPKLCINEKEVRTTVIADAPGDYSHGVNIIVEVIDKQ
jgi:hypothetical protein